MTEAFYAILKASFQGSIVILAVIALRLLLKKAPKSLFCLLWLLAGLRLALPFEIESPLSLQPRLEDTNLSIHAQQTVEVPDILIPNPEGQLLETPAEPVLPPEVPEGNWENVQTESFLYEVEKGTLKPINYGDIAAQVWLLGVAVMLTASAVSYFRLKRRVREAYLIENGCFECPGLDTAFVLGFFPPRIYLPMGLNDQEKKFVFDHENTHIARNDHWFKVLGYGVLSIHWFNPLVWLGYSLLSRDMELACDEHVVKYMTLPQRKAYSAALLSCGGRTARFAACPVAFGESNPKKRILNVLNYKRPGFWITLLTVVAVIFVSVCLLTSPENQVEPPEENLKWNLEMQVTDVTPSGATVEFIQHGPFQGYDRAELQFGSDYSLEKWTGDNWEPVEMVPQEYEVAWTMEAYIINRNGTTTQRINWEWLYGELPPGRYMLGKSVDLFRGTGDSEINMFYAEFTIGDSGLQQCMDALEALQSRDAVHILEVYTFSGDGLPEEQIDRNYFRSGSTWLRVDTTGGGFMGVFENGGFVYISQNRDAIFDWQKAENPEELDAQPWLLTFDISAADVEVISREDTQEGYTLRLMIHETVDMGWLQGEEYYVDFAFDTQGNLLRADAHVGSGFSELTAQMIPVQLSKASIQSAIQQYAGSIVDLEMTEKEYLSMCRDAVAELQNRERFHISETIAYFTGEHEDSRNFAAYWRDGENWLRESYITRMKVNADYFYYDGTMYLRKQEESGEVTWNRIDGGGAGYGDPWLCMLQWDAQTVTFEGTARERDEFRVNVIVQGAPPTIGWDDVQEYQVLFCFDQQGNLLKAILGARRDTLRVVSDLTIENTLASNIRSKLDTVAGQRPDAPQLSQTLTEEQWLEKCRAALENYRAQGSWVVLVENQRRGEGTLTENSSLLWYIHGEDWARHSITGNTDFLKENWYLHKDEHCYSRDSITVHDPANGDGYCNDWEDCEDISHWPMPWPLEFDWDRAEITYVEARTDGQDTVVYLGIAGSPYPAEYGNQVEDYIVTLWLRPSGELWQVRLEYTETEHMGDKTQMQTTISLNAASPVEAERMICQCHDEALLHIHGICNDPACTDSAHDHSGIDCTDDNCTNATHHHGDHDHHH